MTYETAVHIVLAEAVVAVACIVLIFWVERQRRETRRRSRDLRRRLSWYIHGRGL